MNESNSYSVSLKDKLFEVNALKLKSNITLDHNQIDKNFRLQLITPNLKISNFSVLELHRSPDLLCNFGDQFEFFPLIVMGNDVALNGAGKATLWTEA